MLSAAPAPRETPCSIAPSHPHVAHENVMDHDTGPRTRSSALHGHLEGAARRAPASNMYSIFPAGWP